jgi:hypothetical protein
MKHDDEEIRAVVEKQVSNCDNSVQEQDFSALLPVSVAPAKEVILATEPVRVPTGNYRRWGRRWGAPFIL